MSIRQVKTLLHLAASRLEGRGLAEDQEIAHLLRQAEQVLDERHGRSDDECILGPKVVAMSPMEQAGIWEYGQSRLSLLSEDTE